MARDDPLSTYNAKRDFARTPEPAGRTASKSGNSFVVQKHAATRLHWDFRIEVDGVLKSWAVTRGPSLDPEDKRLAVRTEDHPLAYAEFEGVIPKREYGGGTVMLWDRGTWSPIPGKSSADLEHGHLHFTLDGERMRGEWILIRLKPRPGEKRENWLLRKVADEHAAEGDVLVEQALTSIETGRTMAGIADGAPGHVAPEPPSPKPRARRPRAVAAPPSFRPPQLATLVDTVPTGAAWVHEIKYDGYRAQVAVGRGSAVVYTRSGLDWTDKFVSIAEQASALPGSALIDGEIVAFKDGRPDFSTLKNAIESGGDMVLFAFDLLEQDGEDLSTLPLTERKARLRALLPEDGRIHYAEHVAGSGDQLLGQMCAAGLEGVISKRADARYAGGRSTAWLKTKCIQRQEFVIVGWLPSDKGRGLRSLLLGVHEEGELRYAGKVGSGFTARMIDELRDAMEPLARDAPTVDAPRAMVRGARWIEPTLVAEVAFAEVTPDSVLRHSTFLGLRADKPAKEVVAERPAPSTPAPVAPAIVITHPDRVAFPEAGVTKGELAAYYAAIAPAMLPWAGGRPLSLVRCPSGRGKQCFFQKHDAGSFGDRVHRVDVPGKAGGSEQYLHVEDADGLLACIQMGTIEFHGWGSPVHALEEPDRMVFDLDPDEGLAFADTRTAATYLRDQLTALGLVSFPLLSGGKGVHVVVPLTPDAEWPAVKDFADRFARALAQAEPGRFTATMTKAKRRGRIFIDWLRNQRGATAIMPWSARARPGAPVAMPLTWRELESVDGAAGWSARDAYSVLRRASSPGLVGWGTADQRLPDL